MEDKKKAVMAAHSDGLEKGIDIGKDLLSILGQSGFRVLKCKSRRRINFCLVKANMTSDLKPEQRMSDEEVLAQVSTFVSGSLRGS